MKLEDVYEITGCDRILYGLLMERTPEQSISHKGMPTFAEHHAFVESRPYLYWYFILENEEIVGATYLSKNREIGIFIFRNFQGHGYGEEAVKLLMAKHPGKFLANVNPNNTNSMSMFTRLGFDLLQLTYVK